MPQLSIDIDEELRATGLVRSTARSRRFAQNLREGEPVTFESYRGLTVAVEVTRREERLLLDKASRLHFHHGDRIRLVEERTREPRTSTTTRRHFHWFDGASSIVKHIIERADATFLQSCPVQLPADLGTEVGHDLAVDLDVRGLLQALIDHMIYKYLFLAPPLRALGRFVSDNPIEVDGHELNMAEIAESDDRCRRALMMLLDAVPEVLPDSGSSPNFCVNA